MYYASFGILAVVLHVIINHNYIKNWRGGDHRGSHYRYRQFLDAILVFYFADLLWGFFAESDIWILAYADTFLFFGLMALSVLLWTRYVAAFVDKSGLRAKSFMGAGWCIFSLVLVALGVNFFYPILFTFTEDMEYIPGIGRYFLLAVQFLLFVIISVYSVFVSLRSEGRDRIHYMAIGASGGVMAVLIVLQTMNAFAPFYTIGCLIANCLIHVFVEEDEKKELNRINEGIREEKERYTQIAAGLAKDYDAIYYVDIETGKYIEVSGGTYEKSIDVSLKGEDFYAESRENVRKYVYPADRTFAESMYFKETMQKNIEGHKFYSYKYRLMVGTEPRYYRFSVMLSDDEKHYVVCYKDVHETITAETALLEKQKISVTFTQIAESLASNYDVVYYVDINNGHYVGYTAENIYGELKVDESGENFFDDAKKNASLLIHPQDRERTFEVLSRDYLLTTFDRKKRFEYQYRLIVNDKVQHTRFTAIRSSDNVHMIIGVENIDDEVRRENETLKALNSEKELARRDELTGVRNKTAFMELEQSVQTNIDKGMNYLPFAIAVCDLNDLKKINDTKGHTAGDEYLMSSAKLLCEIFDHSPVFRVGGDEFAVFMGGDDYSARKELVDKLRKTSVENRDRQEGPVIAIGIADYDPSGDATVNDTFNRADKLMYEHKQQLKQMR